MNNNCIETGLCANYGARYMLIDCSEALKTARELHNLNEHATKLCAQAMLMSCLLAAHIKGEERLTIQIKCHQPDVSFIADVGAAGDIRVKLTPVSLLSSPSTLYGEMLVIKHNQQKEIYRGITSIDHMSLLECLQHHFSQSTQTDCNVQFSIQKDPLRIYGLMLERLPAVKDIPPLSSEDFQLRYRNLDVQDIRQAIESGTLQGENLHVLSNTPLHWQCTCSRERVVHMLRSLGIHEIQSIRAEIGFAEVSCHFCNARVMLNDAELGDLIEEMKNT